MLSIAVLAATTGCASQPGAGPARAPDEGILAPAQNALTKALDAQADQFAPEPVDAARRRLTIARDVLFAAARQGRPMTSDEHDRVQQLVDQAELDARAALVETQADAVDNQLARLQSGASAGNGSSAGPMAPGSGSGLPDNSGSAGNGLMDMTPIGSQGGNNGGDQDDNSGRSDNDEGSVQ